MTGLHFCDWEYHRDDDAWGTSCGQMHQFIVDGPAENSYKFCPYCGDQLRALKEPA